MPKYIPLGKSDSFISGAVSELFNTVTSKSRHENYPKVAHAQIGDLEAVVVTIREADYKHTEAFEIAIVYQFRECEQKIKLAYTASRVVYLFPEDTTPTIEATNFNEILDLGLFIKRITHLLVIA